MKRALAALFGTLALLPLQQTAAQTVPHVAETLTVDAREAPRRILHVRLDVDAARSGTTLVFPRWVAGEHAPAGRVIDVAALTATADGRRIAWRRDPLDLFAFTFAAPAGTKVLSLRYDVLLRAGVSTPQLLLLPFTDTVFAPRGRSLQNVDITASVLLPAGWRAASALPLAADRARPDAVAFAPVTLERLIDSPVLAGAQLVTVAAGPDAELDVAGDGVAPPVVADDVRAAFTKLVAEAETIFGGHHWNAPYRFLITASDAIGFAGLEHHESSWNGVNADTLASLASTKRFAGDLLTHEFTHSWDGKYRRPAGQAKPNNQVAQEDDQLWVYEGLTEYYGLVLAVRAGFWKPEEFRADLASIAAQLDTTPGRATRALADAQLNEIVDPRGRRRPFLANRFGAGAHYTEGTMIWLDADTLIREQSGGTRSLDDFAKAFFGGTGGPQVVPYTRADIIAALNAVQPYDWASFFAARVDVPTAHPPLAGITRGGWTLRYVAKPQTALPNVAPENASTNWRYGPGMTLNGAGVVGDVLAGSAAARAGLTPGARVVAVDGRRWSGAGFTAAIERASTTQRPIALIVDDRGTFRRITLGYSGGVRQPELARGEGPDRLSEILAPRTR